MFFVGLFKVIISVHTAKKQQYKYYIFLREHQRIFTTAVPGIYNLVLGIY